MWYGLDFQVCLLVAPASMAEPDRLEWVLAGAIFVGLHSILAWLLSGRQLPAS